MCRFGNKNNNNRISIEQTSVLSVQLHFMSGACELCASSGDFSV